MVRKLCEFPMDGYAFHINSLLGVWPGNGLEAGLLRKLGWGLETLRLRIGS